MNKRVLITIACLAAACGDPVAPRPVVPDVSGRIPFQITDAAPTTDPFSFAEASIVGDTLIVAIVHGGGCFDHRYAVVGNARFAESNPVQTRVAVVHDNRNDACRALLSPTLRADISALRERYQRQYGRHGTISLHVHEATLTYTF